MTIPSDPISTIKNHVAQRLLGKEIPQVLIGLEQNLKSLEEILQRGIQDKESSSILLIGGRGTGKTTTVRKALEDKKVHKLYLNGLVHQTEKEALLSIIAQVNTQLDMKNYKFVSFAESLNYLISSIFKKSCKGKEIPLVLVFDHFDIYAAQNSGKQTLLYNLFEAARSNEISFIVFAIACRMDTLESLEKRIKSRFSHRQLFFRPPSSLEQYMEIALQALVLPVDILKKSQKSIVTEYNLSIQNLFKNKEMIKFFRDLYETFGDISSLYKLLYDAVMNLDETRTELNIVLLRDSLFDQYPPIQDQILKSLNILELCLLISLKRCAEKEMSAMNFEIIFHEYKSFMAVDSLDTVTCYPKTLAFAAFEHLIDLGIIEYSERSSKTLKNFREIECLVSQSNISSCILNHPDCPTALKKWGRQHLN